MQKSPGLNLDCFGLIGLLSKKYFNMLSFMIRSKILLQIGKRETGRQFLMFCLLPFLKIGTMFPFIQSSENISHFKQFLNILKTSYSVAGHYQHANTDHIMTMSFIRIEFRDDSFNTILREFKVCQVLIGNGNS